VYGEDIFQGVTSWLDRSYFPSNLTKTNICLIPKCEEPDNMKDLRPISLCNVLYKTVLKLLANRLKRCLDKCVSEEHLVFVERGPLYTRQCVNSYRDNPLNEEEVEGMEKGIGSQDRY